MRCSPQSAPPAAAGGSTSRCGPGSTPGSSFEGDGYRFRHALIRDAVLDRVLPGERAALHGRYAEALRAAGGDAAELSHHLTGAGDGRGAVVAAWAAAAQAHRALAYAEAPQLVERVLGWWDSVPETATLVGADRATVLEKGAEAAVRAGENERGEALVTAALAEPDVRAERVRTAAMLELRARLRARTGRPGVGDDLRRALEVAPADHGIRPYLLNALANLMDIPDPDGHSRPVRACCAGRESGGRWSRC